MQEVAHDDVDSVRRLKAKHLGEHFAMSDTKKVGEEDVASIIVCDDYHHNDNAPIPPVNQVVPPTPAPINPPMKTWPIGLGMAIAGIVLGGAIALPQLLEKPTPTPTPSPVPKEVTKPSVTTIEKRSGYTLDIPD